MIQSSTRSQIGALDASAEEGVHALFSEYKAMIVHWHMQSGIIKLHLNMILEISGKTNPDLHFDRSPKRRLQL